MSICRPAHWTDVSSSKLKFSRVGCTIAACDAGEARGITILPPNAIGQASSLIACTILLMHSSS